MAVVTASDFISKKLAVTWLRPHATPRSVIENWDWFRLTLVHNPGAAFGLHVGEHSRWIFMALTIVVFVILGSVLEGVPALVLLAPLLFPIARQMGIHEVHYSMVVILAMGIGLFAPPFGVGFFTACAIGSVDPDEAMPRIWPYLGALLLATIVVAAVPWISIGFL